MTKEVCTHDVKNSTKYKQSMIKTLKINFIFIYQNFKLLERLK